MNKKLLWVLATIVCGQLVFVSCGNSDNTVTPDTMVLREWQAGRTVSVDAVEAFGGIDKCFAAEPIPDGVWQRMQGKTYKENPYIGRDDLRHIRALHWDYDNQMHVGEMIVSREIADRVVSILRQLFEAKYPIQRCRNMPGGWPSTSTPSTIPITRIATTARASSSPPPPQTTATARGTSLTRSTTMISASASSPRLVSSGAATGLRARTSSILS